jgi:hypothetical protein
MACLHNTQDGVEAKERETREDGKPRAATTRLQPVLECPFAEESLHRLVQHVDTH